MSESKNLEEVLLSPVFIVGAGRSGTTWLQRMFLSHPGVIGGQESEFFLVMTPAIGSVIPEKNGIERSVGLSKYWGRSDFCDEIRGLWKKTFSPLSDGRNEISLLVEKTPSHCIHMAAIKEILPNAKFIHVIRDSRAVAASMMAASRGWGQHWAPGTAKDAAVSWWVSVSAGRSSGSNLSPSEYTEIHYEELLADPVDELRRLFDFSGLAYTDELLAQIVEANRFDKRKSSEKSEFVDSGGNKLVEPKGFYRKGKADSWKADLSLMQKLVIWRYTRKLMHECGYDWEGYQGPRDAAEALKHG